MSVLRSIKVTLRGKNIWDLQNKVIILWEKSRNITRIKSWLYEKKSHNTTRIKSWIGANMIKKKVIFKKWSLYPDSSAWDRKSEKSHVPLCPPVSSGAPNGIRRISQTGGKQQIRAKLESAVSEQLSIARKLWSNGQTRQRWPNMN